MIRKSVLLILIVLLAFIFSGCHIDVQKDVDYPKAKFKKTLKKINDLRLKNPHRKGSASNLNLLVYLEEDRQLISLSIPISESKDMKSMLSTCKDFVGEKDIEKYCKKMNNLKLGNLDSMGPGLLTEVKSNEKNKIVHILIWLD